jgi:hypothetical protein
MEVQARAEDSETSQGAGVVSLKLKTLREQVEDLQDGLGPQGTDSRLTRMAGKFSPGHPGIHRLLSEIRNVLEDLDLYESYGEVEKANSYYRTLVRLTGELRSEVLSLKPE